MGKSVLLGVHFPLRGLHVRRGAVQWVLRGAGLVSSHGLELAPSPSSSFSPFLSPHQSIPSS